MLKLYGCITQQHDLRLVALAAAICVLASLAASALLSRAQSAPGRQKLAWTATAAAEFGGGIWSLHFVAMIAYMPGLSIGYDVNQTLLSILIAIAGSFITFNWILEVRDRVLSVTGGMVFLTLSIGGMHYMGTAAMRLHGQVELDPAWVIWSFLVSAMFSAVAVYVMHDLASFSRQFIATALLALAICALHFMGMSALTLRLGGGGGALSGVLGSGALAVAVGALSIAMLLVSFTLTIVDRHLANRTMHEKERLHQLGSVSFEGLLIERGGIILDVNTRLCELSGYDIETLTGSAMSLLVTGHDRRAGAGRTASGGPTHNLRLLCRDGTSLPVELLARSISYDSGTATAIAIRDLTAAHHNAAAMRRLEQISALLSDSQNQSVRALASLLDITEDKIPARQADAPDPAVPSHDAAAPDPPPPPHDAARPTAHNVGQLHAISLAALKAAYGSDWERVASRAMLMAEQIISRRIGPKDVVTRGDGNDFIIWLNGTDEDHNEVVLIRISREIRISLLTEFGKDVTARVGAVMVRADADEASTAGPGSLLASTSLLNRLGEARQQAVAGAKALLQELRDAPAADAQPVIDRDCVVRPMVVVDFAPDMRRRMFKMATSLTHEPGGTTGIDLQRLDLAIRELAARRGSFTVVVPMSWSSMTEPDCRRALDDRIANVEAGLCKHLIVAVSGVPLLSGEKRWSAVVGPLRRHLSDVALMVTLAPGDVVSVQETIVAQWPLSLLVIDATEPHSMAPDGYFGLIAAARKRDMAVLVQPALTGDVRDWHELGATMFTGPKT